MATVELSAGTIEYEDTGGSKPVVVLVHGVLMDSSVWRNVIAELATDHRCVAPTLPLGAHPHPMRAGADLSLEGLPHLLAEFLERLDVSDVTLVVNDWGGPLVLVADRPERIGRLVVTSCEAFNNIPPGLPGRAAMVAALLPGSFYLNAQLIGSGRCAGHRSRSAGWPSGRSRMKSLTVGCAPAANNERYDGTSGTTVRTRAATAASCRRRRNS